MIDNKSINNLKIENNELQKKIKNIELLYVSLKEKLDKNEIATSNLELINNNLNDVHLVDDPINSFESIDEKGNSNDYYEISESDSELDIDSNENIAIYSNDNEDNNFSNSDLEDFSIDNMSNSKQLKEETKQEISENSDNIVPNIVDHSILVENINDQKDDSNLKLLEESKSTSSGHESSKISEKHIDDEDTKWSQSELTKLNKEKLQCMSEELKIETSHLNGKVKTKKELIDEILKKKSGKGTEKSTSA